MKNKKVNCIAKSLWEKRKKASHHNLKGAIVVKNITKVFSKNKRMDKEA